MLFDREKTKTPDKLVPWNLEPFFSILFRMTVYNILFYIYLHLKVISVTFSLA